MARPAEKARSMLNKWVALREKGNQPETPFSSSRRRPHLASECHHLADAERFRNQIVREIAQSIQQIQNPALPEHEIRDLNDFINRKIREKWYWNKRIVELGGIDYTMLEEKQRQQATGTNSAGDETTFISSSTQYQYFGMAKKLPGVEEFLAQQEKEVLERQQQFRKGSTIHNRITPDYYGWRDEEDGILLELEALATHEQRAQQNDDELLRSPKKRQRDSNGYNNEDREEKEKFQVLSSAQNYLAPSNIPTSMEAMKQRRLEYKKKVLWQQLGL